MFDLDDVTRYVACYSKIPDEDGYCLIEAKYKFAIPISLSNLQNIFNIDPDDPDVGNRYMIDCYKIDEINAKALQPFFDEKIDLSKYQCFLQCDEKKLIERVIRYISVYSNELNEFGGNNLLGVYEFIKPLPLPFLQKLFHADPNDPDTEVRDVLNYTILNEEQANALQPYVREKLDIHNYRTALDCDEPRTFERVKSCIGGSYPPVRVMD